MIRIKMPKYRLIFKVIKDSSKEITALTNKVTRRSNERRLFRNELEVAISIYVETLVVENRNRYMGAIQVQHEPGPVTLNIQHLINQYSDVDQFKDDQVDYAEEIGNLMKVLDASIAEESKKDAADLLSVMSDTKTLCGRSLITWDNHGDTVELLSASDLIKYTGLTHAAYRVPKCEYIFTCTCAKYRELKEKSDAWHPCRGSAERPTEMVPPNAFWFCKEEGRFFNHIDLADEANANKVIVAYKEIPSSEYE